MSAEGFKLIEEHSEDCFCKDDPESAFVLPVQGLLTLDKIGRHRADGAGWTWFAFRCNAPDCPAQMAVRWDVLSRFVGLEGGQPHA